MTWCATQTARARTHAHAHTHTHIYIYIYIYMYSRHLPQLTSSEPSGQSTMKSHQSDSSTHCPLVKHFLLPSGHISSVGRNVAFSYITMTNHEIVGETCVLRCNNEFYGEVSNGKLESVQVIFDSFEPMPGLRDYRF